MSDQRRMPASTPDLAQPRLQRRQKSGGDRVGQLVAKGHIG
jgi:hypothetical protein